MRRSVHLALWLVLVARLPAAAAELLDLGLLVKDKKIYVSFRMTEAFNEDIEKAIASGLPVSFRYEVQLKKIRAIWLNQKVDTRRITNTVTYDNITKRYTLSRDIDGAIVATVVIADLNDMVEFMTVIDDMGLFDVSSLEPNADYYLRVKGLVKERNLFLFVPWDQDSGWEKVYFTYLP
jgi:hypothetical protein